MTDGLQVSSPQPWQTARRVQRMNPTFVREILKSPSTPEQIAHAVRTLADTLKENFLP